MYCGLVALKTYSTFRGACESGWKPSHHRGPELRVWFGTIANGQNPALSVILEQIMIQ